MGSQETPEQDQGGGLRRGFVTLILRTFSSQSAALPELAGILNPVVTVPMNYHPKYFQIDVKLCKLNQ